MSEVDKDLSERYRAASADETRDAPPAHVDAAILAAAKRAVGAQPQATWTPRAARRWYVPVSLAAVLVLSVVVTLQVERERPDIAMPDAVPIERKDQTLHSPAPPAEPARKEKAEQDAPRPADAVRGTAATVRPAARAPAPVPAPAPAPAPAFAPDPVPAAGPKLNSAAEPARLERQRQDALGSAAGRIAEEKTAENSARDAAPQAAPAVAQSPLVAAKPAARVAPQPASQAALAKRDLAPAEWLEQIAELRRQQRDREADEQFAEFRRRYPDYRIPEAMTERIAPRK